MYPLVLSAVVVLSILILGLSTLVTGEIRQTRFVVDDTTHLYVADAVFARELSRLKAAPWTHRWYARREQRDLAGVVEPGSYRGAQTQVVVQDVRGPKGAPVPGLTDVFARVSQHGSAMSYVCRLETLVATRLRPTAVRVRRWARTGARVDTVEGREQVLARLATDEEARDRDRARTATLVREARRRLSAYGANTEQVVRELKRGFAGEEGSTRTVIDRVRDGDAQLQARPPHAEAAVEAYAEALPTARAQHDLHRIENVALVLERLVQARTLLAEAAPVGKRERQTRLAAARDLCEQLVRECPGTPEAARAGLRRAWLTLKESDPTRIAGWRATRARTVALITELGETYRDIHLWDEDRTVGACVAELQERTRPAISWTQGGRLMIAPLKRAGPLAPGKAARLLPGLGPQGRARWSPDGSALVLDAEVAPDRHAVFTCDATGLELRRWTPDAWGDCRAASFSPDGAHLVFARAQGRKSEICTIAADGSDLRVLTPESMVATDPAWSSGGSQIAFASGDAIWMVEERGGAPQRVTRAEGGGVVHSQPAPATGQDVTLYLRGGAGQPAHIHGAPRGAAEVAEAAPEDVPADARPEDTAPEDVTPGTHDYTSFAWFLAADPGVVATRRAGTRGASLVVLDPEKGEPTLLLDAPGESLDGPALSPVPAEPRTGEPDR